jgi:DNA-binding NtrC family response regulator
MSARVLIADDEASLRKVLSSALKREGYDTVTVKNGEEALEVLEASVQPDTGEPFSLVISDVRMPGMDGMTLLQRIKKRFKDLPVVMLTAHGTVDLAVQALKQGAFDFITKPYERDDLLAIVKKAIAHRDRDEREPTIGGAGDDERTLVGNSPRIQKVIEIIDKVADSPSTVLVTGESGTGKSLVAREIHRQSGRTGRFVEVACGALNETLLESELFGHVAGAFTGATADREGRFLQADGGTIFLDEIATATPAMQVKLLRVLQDMAFEPVGGSRTHAVDARVILATHESLEQLVADGRFRADLYWRINVVTLEMPPLRSRASDIPALAAHFLAAAAAKAGRRVEGFTPAALDALMTHDWPGNVRELEHAVSRAAFLGRGPRVDVADLPPTVLGRGVPGVGSGALRDSPPLKAALAGPERQMILDALERSGWRRDAAARALGINRTTLYKKARRLGMNLAELAPGR